MAEAADRGEHARQREAPGQRSHEGEAVTAADVVPARAAAETASAWGLWQPADAATAQAAHDPDDRATAGGQAETGPAGEPAGSLPPPMIGDPSSNRVSPDEGEDGLYGPSAHAWEFAAPAHETAGGRPAEGRASAQLALPEVAFAARLAALDQPAVDSMPAPEHSTREGEAASLHPDNQTPRATPSQSTDAQGPLRAGAGAERPATAAVNRTGSEPREEPGGARPEESEMRREGAASREISTGGGTASESAPAERSTGGETASEPAPTAAASASTCPRQAEARPSGTASAGGAQNAGEPAPGSHSQPGPFQNSQAAVAAPPAPEDREALPSTPSATPTGAAARAAAEEIAPPPTPSPHTVSLHLEDGESSVNVRLAERAGEIRVTVHTADRELADSMRAGLPDLVGKLRQGGFQAEVWRPSGAAQSDTGRRGGTESSPFQNPQHHSRRDQRQKQAPPHERTNWAGEWESSLGAVQEPQR